jgi:hypothetical protein
MKHENIKANFIELHKEYEGFLYQFKFKKKTANKYIVPLESPKLFTNQQKNTESAHLLIQVRYLLK